MEKAAAKLQTVTGHQRFRLRLPGMWSVETKHIQHLKEKFKIFFYLLHGRPVDHHNIYFSRICYLIRLIQLEKKNVECFFFDLSFQLQSVIIMNLLHRNCRTLRTPIVFSWRSNVSKNRRRRTTQWLL